MLIHLAPGDVVTHAFHGGLNGLLRPDGSVHPDAHDAQADGVIFDVGHAGEHFDASVARQAVDDGFLPDTLSTDVHWLPGSNVPSMADIINQFLGFGVPFDHLVRGSTDDPARVIGRPDLADLERDSVTDATIVALADNKVRVLATVHNERIVHGQEWLAATLLAPQR
jgi:dihydroorotase